LNQTTDETDEPILTKNISKPVTPRKVRTFGVKTLIAQFYGVKFPQNSP